MGAGEAGGRCGDLVGQRFQEGMHEAVAERLP